MIVTVTLAAEINLNCENPLEATEHLENLVRAAVLNGGATGEESAATCREWSVVSSWEA